MANRATATDPKTNRERIIHWCMIEYDQHNQDALEECTSRCSYKSYGGIEWCEQLCVSDIARKRRYANVECREQNPPGH